MSDARDTHDPSRRGAGPQIPLQRVWPDPDAQAGVLVQVGKHGRDIFRAKLAAGDQAAHPPANREGRAHCERGGALRLLHQGQHHLPPVSGSI